jgi:transcriptional regulator with XRE-family HTH domain
MKDSEGLNPAVHRRRLVKALRQARLDAELTQEQAASEMDWSLSKLIRIENGSAAISSSDLKALLQHYKITKEKRSPEEVLTGLCWRKSRVGFRPGACVEIASHSRAGVVRRIVRPGGPARILGSGRRMFANLDRISVCI